MTNHMNQTAATARHRKDLTEVGTHNTVEAITRWWVIRYAPGTAPYVISERPRIIAAAFAALEVTDDGATVAAFFAETDLDGRKPTRCVRRVTAECTDITAYDSWEAAVATAYPAGQPNPDEAWETEPPLTEADLDAVFAHFDAPAPVPVESDVAWLRRLEAGLAGLPEGVVPLRRRAPSLWDDADPFIQHSPETGPEASHSRSTRPGAPTTPTRRQRGIT